jgi:hypothetical protein
MLSKILIHYIILVLLHNNSIIDSSTSIPEVTEPNIPFISPSSTFIPTVTEHNIPARLSSRIRKQPSYLQDYHCQLASSSSQMVPNSMDMSVSNISGISLLLIIFSFL